MLECERRTFQTIQKNETNENRFDRDGENQLEKIYILPLECTKRRETAKKREAAREERINQENMLALKQTLLFSMC